MVIKNLKSLSLKDKLVLLRIDINSPVVNSKIIESPRFKESSITINDLIKKGSKIVILAHQGRKGDKDFLSLSQHAEFLSKYTKSKVKYVDSLFDASLSSLKSGEVILLKNVREYEDELEVEKKGNKFHEFSKKFDYFVNDAFSVSHRSQSSIIIPPQHIPSAIGLSFEKELAALNKFSVKKHAKNVFLIGGAKVEDYIPLFNVLDNKKNVMLVSGVLANLIMVSQDGKLGYENEWLGEKDYLKLIPKIKSLYEKYEDQIVLPSDFAVGSLSGNDKRKEISVIDFPTDEKIWDVGHETTEDFKGFLEGAKTIFMKGPLGFAEMEQYSYGTTEMLKEISKLSKKGTFSLLGGGHLTTVIEEYKIPNNFSHISTSGGALIAYISGQELPGLIALEKNK